MKLVLFCLLAGVIPGWNETRVATFAPIALYTQFEQAPPAGVLEALQEEVEWIMAPIGLRFEWRDLGKTGGHEVSAELVVVTFKGRCDAAGLTTRSRFEGALGWTHVSDGQILPFTDINCDRVRQFTQSGLLVFRPEDRTAKYGRALGRVLAHELYHIFANTTRHGSIGVAKESYNMQDLLADDFQFQAKESRMLQTNRQRPAVESTAATMEYSVAIGAVAGAATGSESARWRRAPGLFGLFFGLGARPFPHRPHYHRLPNRQWRRSSCQTVTLPAKRSRAHNGAVFCSEVQAGQQSPKSSVLCQDERVAPLQAVQNRGFFESRTG